MDIAVMRFMGKQSAEQRAWYDKMPRIPFPNDWDVRAVPPFGGAMVRYRIQRGGAEVSVYMDAHDKLGCVGQPYWEIHPNPEGECDRFLLREVDDLVAGIAAALDAQS